MSYLDFTNQGILYTTHNHSLLILKFLKSKPKNLTPAIDAKDVEKPPELPLPIFTPNHISEKQTLLVAKVRNLKNLKNLKTVASSQNPTTEN